MKKTTLYACLMVCMLCFGPQARASACETPEYETKVIECYWWIFLHAFDGPMSTPTALRSLESIRAIAQHQGESLPPLSEVVAEVIDLLEEYEGLEESEAYAQSFYELALYREACISGSKHKLRVPKFDDITLTPSQQNALIMAFAGALIEKLSDPECQSIGAEFLQAGINDQQG